MSIPVWAGPPTLKKTDPAIVNLSITQNNLRGTLLENLRVIDGCVIVKEYFDETNAQLVFRGALYIAILKMDPNINWNPTYVHIGHFEC